MTKADAVNPKPARRSRDNVVAAARAILDEQGLPGLTMRNLAAALGLQVSALYWHFPNKQSLLAAVADEIVQGARHARPVPADWRDAARGEARALRAALLGVNDGAELVTSTLALGLGRGRAATRLAEAVALGGFSSRTAGLAAAALLHFVLGHASLEQQRRQAARLGVTVPDADGPDGIEALTGTEAFEFGLDLIIDGLDRLDDRGEPVAAGGAAESAGRARTIPAPSR